MRVSAPGAGFSLIEAAVAAAVLALGCLASAGVLQVVLRAESAGLRGLEARQLLDAEAARLRALPFFRRADGPDSAPASLLAEVFPHARRESNRPPAGFGDGSGAAVFLSEVRVAGSRVRRTATLVRDVESEPLPLLESEVEGWAVWEDARPPALAVDITLEVVGAARGVSPRHLVLRALRPADADAAVRTPALPAVVETVA